MKYTVSVVVSAVPVFQMQFDLNTCLGNRIETQSAEALKTVYVTNMLWCVSLVKTKQYDRIIDLLRTNVMLTDDKSCFQL